MSDTNSTVTTGGTGVLGLLGLLFIGLKLGHVINWSWWWVTVPFWGPWLLVMPILAIILVLAIADSK
jgi:hypothetical protein